MTNLNRVTILGNVGNEPKKAATSNGKQVTRLSVATNKRFKDDAGEWKSKTTWHSVVAWGDAAEYAAKIESGALVFIEGELQTRTYEREVETLNGGTAKVNWPVVEIVASSISAIKANGGSKEKGEAA